MEDSRRAIQVVLEGELRAREKREKELACSGKAGRTSTLHREADFTLESPADGPPPATRPLSPRSPRRAGETVKKNAKTSVAVRYSSSRGNEGPTARVRGNGAPAERQDLGEFERRLINAKKLGKAPMPSVDQIP